VTVSAQASAAAAGIRTRPAPTCVVCGGAGHERHAGLVDRLFGAPGTWRLVGCGSEGCGLLWLDPTPLAEDLGLAYQAYYTHASPTHAGWRRAIARWIKQGHFASRFGYRVPAAVPKRLLAAAVRWNTNLCDAMDRMVFFLEPLPGGRLLDVGCGDGHSLAELRALGWEAEGVDFDPLAAKAAEARGIRVRVGSLEAQRYPDATFDAVTMSHLIEHVPDPVALLAECRRVLKPEGRLVAVTPNVDSLGHARFGRDWRGLEPPRHLQIFSATALERAARRAGLAVRTLRTLAGGARFIHAQSQQIAGAPASAADAWRFEREERAALRDRPGVGEELLLVAGRS
jgi:SAM-dependent methyltransferase